MSHWAWWPHSGTWSISSESAGRWYVSFGVEVERGGPLVKKHLLGV
ncbi:MAG: hypothetical protein ACYC1D_07540 [Acidimicrobiales bacterium]